jgi:hypothetical protein
MADDNRKEFKQIYSIVPTQKKSKWSKFKSFMSYDVSFSSNRNSIFQEIKDFWNQDIRFRRARKSGLWLPAPQPEPVLIPIPIDEQRYDNQKDLKKDIIKVEAESVTPEMPQAKQEEDDLFAISDSTDDIQKEVDIIFGDIPKAEDKDRSLSGGKTNSPYLRIDL